MEADNFCETIEEKERLLINRIMELRNVIVAYSGGVDSSLLAYYAKRLLRNRARVVIAVSPSVSKLELQSARAQAALFEWNLTEIATDEHEKPEYQRNDDMRCFFCKATLFEELHKMARRFGVDHIVYGANMDDVADFRPGELAAGKFKVLSPLRDAGLTKDEIRKLALKAGLPSWDKPQDACLASRVTQEITVTPEVLGRVEKAERFVREKGFNQVRVRHKQDAASVEVGPDEVQSLLSNPDLCVEIIDYIEDLGYAEVEIDPRGYKTGGANPDRKPLASPSFAQISATVSGKGIS